MKLNDLKQKPENLQIDNELIGPLAGADSAISLLGKAILPKAVELARIGKYPEAEVLLEHLIHENPALPAVYDLMARIRAQQGRLLEAQGLWAEAIRQNSSRETYQSALKCIEHLQKFPSWTRRFRPVIPVAILVVGVIIILFAVLPFLHNLKLPAVKSLPALPKKIVVSAPIEKPDIIIDIPGIITGAKNNQLILTFEFGLFSQLTQLRPEAKSTLDLLGAELRPHVGKIQVNVEGHTDDLPILSQLMYRDNVSLGLQRAVTVIDYLRINSDLPAKMFKASSMGDSQSLYPNDTFDNQLRNRTVVIKIVGTIN